MHQSALKYFHKLACVIFTFLVSLYFVGCGNTNIIKGITTIDELEWEAVAEIQEYKTCNDNGWEVPDGAIVYKEQEEIKSYKIVGYETKYRTEEYQEQIGYYRPTWRPRYETRTRQVAYREAIKEPVYATKYYYTIDKWVTSNIKVALANGYTTDYSYPEYICDENERVSNVEYQYLAKFKFNGREISYVVDKDRWERLRVGQEIYVEEDQHWTITVDLKDD